MKEISKEEMDKTIEEYREETIPTVEPFDDLWALMILALIFTPNKPDKIVNIYLGDDK